MKKNLLKKTLLLLLALVAGGGSVWATDPDLTLDFTSAWTDGGTNSSSEQVFTKTVGTTTYTISGTGGANFKFNTGYFFFGKSGAYINLPTVGFDVEKIEVVGNSGASAKTTMNIYVGTDAVSTETTGSTGTNSYTIASTKQTAGTQYILKVTNANNAQVTYIKYYKKAAVDLTSFAFDNTTPSVTLSKSGSTFDASYSQAVTVAPAAYDGTISYSFDEGSSTFDLSKADIDGATGDVEISADANIASAQTIVVKASATGTDKYKKPADATYTLTVNPAPAGVGTPEFSQAEGSYYYGTTFTISSANSNKIYYTTDGSDPSKTNGTLYDGAIAITSTVTVKAIGYDGDTAGEIGSVTYTLKAPEVPTFSVSGGGVTEGTSVVLEMGDGGTKVVYTTDGTDPTASSTEYSSAITINSPVTIKAATVDAGNNLSTVVTNAYTIVVIKAITLWSEDFGTYNADDVPNDKYTIDNGGGTTKIYDATLAGGTSPELLVAKNNGYLKATIPLDNNVSPLTLTYKANYNYLEISVKSSPIGATVGEISYDSEKKTAAVTISHVTESMTSIDITFTNSNKSSNCRLDNILLTYNKQFNTEPVTVTAAGYATYVTPYAIDFTGVKAYKVSAVGTNNVTLDEITEAPANTPVVIKAAEGSYNLAVQASATAVTGNLLQVSDGSVTGNGSTIYALGNKTHGVGFYPVTNGQAIPAGKAYLVDAGGGVKEFLGFGDDTTTKIESVKTIENGVMFNLAGQRVNKAQKGIFIVNGKKVVR
ncbi:MAG: chitobiase/beta-hexosaminidase C-terminal domain-containing protein [Bacteroidaceae bacterium]|nr:chitobiase/beta-hexosaminidase C-terminal domain-containing protein [Bacteroidaceae bacterium]